MFVPEPALTRYYRREKGGLALPGKKRPMETGYFFKAARGLARLAEARAKKHGGPVGAVLFRDTDGTAASRHSLCEDKVRSMEAGFAVEGFALGVPMVPKPKSEAWLLCAVQRDRYQHCAGLETMSGNDASPKSVKAALAKALAGRARSFTDVGEMIQRGEIDPRQVEMPSFDEFRERLEAVAEQMSR